MAKILGKRQPRTPYPNQELIRNRILDYLTKRDFKNPFVRRVYLIGSLVDGQFGIFNNPEKTKRGFKFASDVDLIVVGDDHYEISETWKKRGEFIWDLYDLPELNSIEGIRDGIHKVTALVHIPSKAELPPANPRGIDDALFRLKTRKECLEYHIKNYPIILWYGG
ncbi:hypothetical protein GF386_03385 [Candidatus Pacearchaeota archaeon]|nr:hypothetical protein [Candidatus Pacearchaeota archaeon]MBD3283184.1 hypothetical protein [Candidatus Pacearchaeota archaeon]